MQLSFKLLEIENEIRVIEQQIEQCELIIDLIQNFPQSDLTLYEDELLVTNKIKHLKRILINRQRNLKEALDIFREVDYTVSIYSQKIESVLHNLDEV